MCGALPTHPYRLRVGEQRGIGPWEPSYFKRPPNDAETRQDLLELQALCEEVAARERRFQEVSRQRHRDRLAALADTPIPEIERLMGKVKRSRKAREQVIACIEALDCDDPRKRRYRTLLANQLM